MRALQDSAERARVLLAVGVLLQNLEKTWRGRYEEALGALGTQGLQAIWGDDRALVLESKVTRGVTNLDLALAKHGERVRLKGGSGGSVVQVLAVVLRILTTLSHRPEWRPLLVLDEPFSMVAAQQRPALCAMMQGLTQRLGFQSIFSSHEDELLDAADVAYLVHEGGRVECIKHKAEDRT